MDPSTSSSSPSSSLALYHLDQGNTYLINNQYDAAISSYTTCIQSASALPSQNENEDENQSQSQFITFRAYSHRAESYLQLQDYHNAKADAQNCHTILSSQSDSYSEASQEVGMSYIRLGKACFELKEYQLSLEAFEKAESYMISKPMSEAETESNLDSAELDVNAKLILKFKTKCETILDALPSTVGDVSTPSSSTTATTVTNKTAPPATTMTTTTTKKTPTMPKYQYYQDENYLTISILEPNLSESTLKAQFSLDKLTVIVQKQNKNFTVICGTLFSAVNVSKCKVKFKAEKTLIKLKKKHKHDWHTLFGGGATDADKEEYENENNNNDDNNNNVAEAGAADTTATAATATTTTTAANTSEIPMIDPSTTVNRPYASHRNWDAIERNIEREEEEEKPEGEGAFQKFLQSMYAGADDDTRRAMIKSYQTSGGTHLSGNWDEVSKTDYEKQRTAPKGQEWKNWEGEKLPMKDD